MSPIEEAGSRMPQHPPQRELRIGVLSNLRAGQRDSKIESVLAFLERHPEIVRRETPDGKSVAPALTEMAAEGVEVLALNGGDGTVQHALTQLYADAVPGWQPWIAPVAGGRTNTIALDFGGAAHPVQGLSELIEANRAARLADRVVHRPVQRVELAEGVQYGMFLGFGMLHRAVSLVHTSFPEGKARGTYGAGLVTAALVARAAIQPQAGGILAPDRIRFTLDGASLDADQWRLAMSCTLQRLHVGIRIRPFWGSERAPMQVTLVEPNAKQIARSAISILRGRPGPHVLEENGYFSRNVREFTAELDSGVILDGELFPPTPGRVVRVTAYEASRFLRA